MEKVELLEKRDAQRQNDLENLREENEILKERVNGISEGSSCSVTTLVGAPGKTEYATCRATKLYNGWLVSE